MAGPRRTLLRLAFWAACAMAFAVAVMPNPPSLPVWDKILHALAFVVLATLGILPIRQ